MVVEAPDALAAQLRGVSRVELSGPGLLNVVFPGTKSFSKTFCERPETFKRLCVLASDLAGYEISMRFQVDQSAAPREAGPVVKKRPPESERKRNSFLDQDPFIQQAISIFGGRVEEVRTLLTPSTQYQDQVEQNDEDE